MIVKAVVVALKTEDGLCEMEAHVPLGKTYLVDLNTIDRQRPMVRQLPDGTCHAHHKDIIYLATGEGWLPMELLRLEA